MLTWSTALSELLSPPSRRGRSVRCAFGARPEGVQPRPHHRRDRLIAYALDLTWLLNRPNRHRPTAADPPRATFSPHSPTGSPTVDSDLPRSDLSPPAEPQSAHTVVSALRADTKGGVGGRGRIGTGARRPTPEPEGCPVGRPGPGTFIGRVLRDVPVSRREVVQPGVPSCAQRGFLLLDRDRHSTIVGICLVKTELIHARALTIPART